MIRVICATAVAEMTCATETTGQTHGTTPNKAEEIDTVRQCMTVITDKITDKIADKITDAMCAVTRVTEWTPEIPEIPETRGTTETRWHIDLKSQEMTAAS